MKNTFVITNGSVVVDVGDEVPYTIFKENPAYEELVNLLSGKNPADVDWEAVKQVMNPTVEKLSNDQMRRTEDGAIEVLLEDGKWFKCPSDLGDALGRFMDAGTDLMPLVRFAQKLSKNPNPEAVQRLFTFLSHNRFTITESGDFVAFRSIRSDWLDHHSKSMNNRPGQVVEMKRSDVNASSSTSCAAGLHLGSWNYSYNSFMGSDKNSRMIVASCSPEDVVSVPLDYNGEKLRACKFTSLAEVEQEGKGNLYSEEKGFHDSDYEPSEEQYIEFGS